MSLLIKPKHLRRGDTVGIVAPSSAPFEQSDIQFTYEWLTKLGLKYKVGKHVFDSYSDMAGTDLARLADFHAMWADREINAILPIRGGNGAARLLPLIDYELIRRNPKFFIGYSDITCLLLAIHKKTGLVTFHGPTAGSFYRSSYTHHYFLQASMNARPIGNVNDPVPSEMWHPKYPPYRVMIAPGKARGPLIGGCLTLIKQLMGTPYEIDVEDKIVFLEDLAEEPHAIDRYLTQLLLAGKLQKAKGIIVADCLNCRPGESGRNILQLNYSLESVLRDRLGSLGIPVVYGMRFGHGTEQFTLPIGCTAYLEASEAKIRFKIEESATV